MKTIDQIRHTNLVTLIEKHGSIAALNEAIGLPRTDATLSQIKNKNLTSRGNPKMMGDELARRVEAQLGLPTGWMDNDHSVVRFDGGPIATVIAAMEAMTPLQQTQLVKVVAALAEPPPKASNGE